MECYLKRNEVAKRCGVSPRMVSGWVREGCPVIYMGRKRSPGRGSQPRFLIEEVEGWLRERSRSGERGRAAGNGMLQRATGNGAGAFFPQG